MRPRINEVWFGSITVAGTRYEHDIIIRLSGKVCKRRKALSKAVYGTSHTISLAEIQDLYRPRAQRLIIGTGHQDQVRLAPDAAEFLAGSGLSCELYPTAEAVEQWNRAQGLVLALIHVTC